MLADPDRIEPEYFQSLDERIRYLNQKGVAADLVLGAGQGQLEKLLPNWKQRERYVRYLVARYAAMNVTWQGVEAYEEYENGPALLKEIADLLKQVDPYRHPRATHSTSTSAPLASAGWLDYATCQSTETNLFAVEHQFYPLPFVNLGSPGADPDTARKRLWNAAINGQYVTLGEAPLDSAAAQQATHLYTFFAQTRYWDLEPYFRIEGARALALEEVEYIVYLEKPGPVELMVHKAGYEVSWFNPITGAWVDDANFKGERYTVGNPPDASHDWVLYVRREGKKQGMNRSYKFESRTPVMQPLEVSKKEVPFSIQLPEESELKVDQKYEFNATLLKPSRATRNMIWLWTGEVPSSFLGYKVLGTTQFGTFLIPPGLTRDYPTTLQVRLYGLDGNGKLFASDKVYTLKK